MDLLIIAGDYPGSKVHGANMGPSWVLAAPDGPHVGPMNLAIRVYLKKQYGLKHPILFIKKNLEIYFLVVFFSNFYSKCTLPMVWSEIQSQTCIRYGFALVMSLLLITVLNHIWTMFVYVFVRLIAAMVMINIRTSLIARFMGSICGRQDPGGPHVGPMNLTSLDLK